MTGENDQEAGVGEYSFQYTPGIWNPTSLSSSPLQIFLKEPRTSCLTPNLALSGYPSLQRRLLLSLALLFGFMVPPGERGSMGL